jgi:pSer/pThr/pTyr-binding forkhead associated (FHA) protein
MKNDKEPEKSGTLILGEEHARLIIENGADKGKEFLLHKDAVTIGRHPDNDVCLSQDRTVSRFHGSVSLDANGTYFFEDLNSTNGTTIGDNWFKNEKVEIKHGDRIVLGRQSHEPTILRFYTKKLGLKDWILG